ncbi:hypothetical protein ACJIZ3_013379 [Penstemon smallii]|uniref:Disease resistance R13L4/SHOC-2-like LRR domain-containing protein n=1 Tax=Penstemon smallii TaxID=265156 RepID=A0ABD3UTC0_9LAMI
MAFLPLFLVGFLLLSIAVHGGEVVNMDMEEDELFGLFEVMGSLLEDPTWAQMHPLPCTETPWPGVECELLPESSIFHVTKIHLGPDIITPPCKSSAKISNSLLKLPYLKTFSLMNCFTKSPFYLTNPLFGTFSSNLEHLTLDSNPTLFGPIPPSLPNLKTLCLSQNNLSGQIPREIGKLVDLQQLDLSHNHLTGPIPEEIGNLKSLTILDISLNSLQGTVPVSISRLQLLEKLDLSWNNLEGKLPYELGKLKKLVLLDLSHNSLTGPIPEGLSGLEQLQYLIIQENSINSGIPLFIGSLINLSVLSLSGCGLTGQIPNVFTNLRNLTALYLDNNSLTGTVPVQLGTILLNLDMLNLSRNKLSGELLINEDFVNRLGPRLDIRENSGLRVCQEEAHNKNPNHSPYMKPTLYEGNMSCNKYCLDQKFVFFPSVVFLFLLFGS